MLFGRTDFFFMIMVADVLVNLGEAVTMVICYDYFPQASSFIGRNLSPTSSNIENRYSYIIPFGKQHFKRRTQSSHQTQGTVVHPICMGVMRLHRLTDREMRALQRAGCVNGQAITPPQPVKFAPNKHRSCFDLQRFGQHTERLAQQ